MIIKRHIIFILCGVYALSNIQLHAHGWLTTTEKALFGWINYFRSKKKVSNDFEYFCRLQLQQAGVDDYKSVIIINEQSTFCPAIASVWFGRCLKINENRCKKMPLNQQKYLLFHEAGHLALHHWLKIFTTIVTYSGLYFLLIRPLNNKYIHQYVSGKFTQSACKSLVFITTFGICALACLWTIELNADIYAFNKLDKLRGALNHLNDAKNYDNEYYKEQNLLQYWWNIRFWHPPSDWSISIINNRLQKLGH